MISIRDPDLDDREERLHEVQLPGPGKPAPLKVLIFSQEANNPPVRSDHMAVAGGLGDKHRFDLSPAMSPDWLLTNPLVPPGPWSELASKAALRALRQAVRTTGIAVA